MKFKCAGIVLFNPNLERLEQNIKEIYPQVESLILIDNNSDNFSEIYKKYNLKPKVEIISNSENMGIATALNQIVLEAKKQEYSWVMLLDQDSVVSPNIIKSYENYLELNSIALLTPYIIDINKMSVKEYNQLLLKEYDDVRWAITSASLINIDAYEKVGGFYNELFIDMVDLDFSNRLMIRGYKQLRINNCYLLQEVGFAEKTWIKVPHKDNSGKWTIKTYYRTNHSLFRQYYMVRNRVILARRFNEFNSYSISMFKLLIYSAPKLLVEKNKYNLLKAMLKGYRDGKEMEIMKFGRS